MGAPFELLAEGDLALRPLPADRAVELARRISTDPIASPWWTEDAGEIARWLTDPATAAHVIEAGGRVVGVLIVTEEDDPYYRHAQLDITLFADAVGRGIGPRALTLVMDALATERGHHRFTLDPAADNARAIRAYEKAGFRRVGVMRRYERTGDGTWRDGLLMERVVEPPNG
ncbi:MAG: GNAT family protein [Anaerosomatales bacterium]|nr:GNAT family protein [Anaerosomatales bacterium]